MATADNVTYIVIFSPKQSKIIVDVRSFRILGTVGGCQGDVVWIEHAQMNVEINCSLQQRQHLLQVSDITSAFIGSVHQVQRP
jgi:hypothetical protein